MDSISRVIAQQKPHDLMDLLGDDPAGNVVSLRGALDAPIDTSIFPDAFAKSIKVERLSLRQLEQKIVATKGERKADLPLLKLATFGDKKTDKGTIRHDANMLEVTGIEGDYDAGELSMPDAAARLRKAGLAGLFYTSTHHDQTAPRWRVLVPLSKAFPATERHNLCARLNSALGGALAPESFTLSQTYYFGAAERRDASKGGGEAAPLETLLVDGLPLDKVAGLEALYPEGGLTGGGLRAATTDKPTDESRSGRAFRLASEFKRRGKTEDDYRAALAADPNLRAWAKDNRQVRRAWQKAPGFFVTADDFDDAPVIPWVKQPLHYHFTAYSRKYAAVLTGGRTKVLAQGENGLELHDMGGLKTFYANRKVVDPKWIDMNPTWKLEDWNPADPPADPAERPDFKESFPIWWAWADRPSYSGVTFRPDGVVPDGYYNLWRGWSVEPDATASCALFLSHLHDVICDGDADLYHWLIRWMAHMVQKPAEKPGTALILRGSKGSGKDTVGEYLGRMFQRNHVKISSPEHLTGHFNAHLAEALLLHVEEAFWAGDKKAQGQLQSLITSERVAIERKGLDVAQMRSYTRVLMSSNEDRVVPASFDERRYIVLNISDRHMQDPAYFVPLNAEMDGDGPAALLHHLQQIDLAGFDVRNPPNTVGLMEQKRAGLKGFDLWWYGRLSEGDLHDDSDDLRDDPPPQWREKPILVRKNYLYAQYVEFHKGRKYDGDKLTIEAFSKKLVERGVKLVRPRIKGERPHLYSLPSLVQVREAFTRTTGIYLGWGDENAQ